MGISKKTKFIFLGLFELLIAIPLTNVAMVSLFPDVIRVAQKYPLHPLVLLIELATIFLSTVTIGLDCFLVPSLFNAIQKELKK